MSAKSPTIQATFLTRRIGWYVVIFVAAVGIGAFFVLPVEEPHIRRVMLAFAVPIVGAIYWTVCRELVHRVSVGSDGVYLHRLNRTRFLAFAEIADVVEESDALTLVLRSGRHERITTNRTRHAFRTRHSARADALVARIRRAIAERPPDRESSSSAPDALFLRVRALLTEGPARLDVYRETAIPDLATLRALVLDPTVAQQTRAAAAVALRADQEGRALVAAIVPQTASPSLAALFTTVTSERSVERIAAALDEVGKDDYDAPISGA